MHDLVEYLRVVDCFVYFHITNEVLLVSEREANFLVEQVWQKDMQGINISLMHHSFIRQAAETNFSSPESFFTFKANKVSVYLISAMQLFGGEAIYKSTRQKECVRKMLSYNDSLSGAKIDASNEPEILVTARGHSSLLFRSDLEKICKDIVIKNYLTEAVVDSRRYIF